MDVETLKMKVKKIVEKTAALKDQHIDNKNAAVNYACIFSHSEEEYQGLIEVSRQIGAVIQETPTGPLFQIEPLHTVSGALKLLKIRIPDPTRPEKGDADFTILNFSDFEKKYLGKPGFQRVEKEHFI